MLLRVYGAMRRFANVVVVKNRWESIYGRPPLVPNPHDNQNFGLVPTLPKKSSVRTGVLAVKVGMTNEWDKWGVQQALTVLQIDRCQVVQIKTKEKDGYDALQVGIGEEILRKVTKPLVGHFVKSDVPPKKTLKEFRITPECVLPVGYEIMARHFIVGQKVDVGGITIGKGFAGGIKRWGFHRQQTTHGNSLTTRTIGSTGNRQDPGRTFPGKKMPGHMGCNHHIVKNLIVYKIDSKRNLVYVRGAVPGHRYTTVEVFDSIYTHHLQYSRLLFPTFVPSEGVEYPAVETMEAKDSDHFETMFMHDNYLPKCADPTSTAIA